MPPKGAWKPSLNVSTLLASVGLLLAEPNPEDGLVTDVVGTSCWASSQRIDAVTASSPVPEASDAGGGCSLGRAQRPTVLLLELRIPP